jgi:hypothetical protein
MCYGFKTFSEAAYACWDVERTFENLLHEKFRLKTLAMKYPTVPPGYVEHEKEIWDLMADAIEKANYKGKVGSRSMSPLEPTTRRRRIGSWVSSRRRTRRRRISSRSTRTWLRATPS